MEIDYSKVQTYKIKNQIFIQELDDSILEELNEGVLDTLKEKIPEKRRIFLDRFKKVFIRDGYARRYVLSVLDGIKNDGVGGGKYSKLNSAMAINVIMKAYKSTAYVMDNLRLTDEERRKVGDTVPIYGLAETIGKNMLMKLGYIMVGDGAVKAQIYKELGMKKLRDLEEAGLVKIIEEGYIPNNGYYEAKYKAPITEVKLLMKVPVLKLNREAFDIAEITEGDEGYRKASEIFFTIANLYLPSNSIVPATARLGNGTKNEINPFLSEFEPKGSIKEIMDAICNVPKKFTSSSKRLLDAFAEVMDEIPENETMERFLKERFYCYYPHLMKAVFGMKKLSWFEKKNADSAYGKKISKFHHNVWAIENHNQKRGSGDYLFFQQTFMPRNGRIHYYEVLYNEQLYKDARYMTAGGKRYYYKNLNVVAYVLASFLDEMKIYDPNVVLSYGYDETLDKILDDYLEARNRDEYFTAIDRALEYFGEDNAFKTVLALDTIKAFRDYKITGKFRAEYYPAPDATGSGIMIQLFQESFNPKVQRILKDIRDGKFRDVYAVFIDIIEKLGELASDPEKVSKNAELRTYKEFYDAFVLLGMVLGYREMVKMPMIAGSYEQQMFGMVNDIVDGVVEAIFENERIGIRIINYFLEKPVMGMEEFKEDYDEKMKELRYGIKDKFATSFYMLYEENYRTKLFKERKKSIGELFKIIKKVYKDYAEPDEHFRIIHPFALLNEEGDYAKLYNDFGNISLMKEVTLVDLNKDVTYNKNVLNEISANVLVTHAMDATILMEALKETGILYEEKYNLNLQLIHDQIRAHPKKAMELEKAYKKAIVKVMKNVDYREVLIKSIRGFLESHNADEDYKKSIESELSEIESQIEKDSEAKREFISKEIEKKINKMNLFGFLHKLKIVKKTIKEAEVKIK